LDEIIVEAKSYLSIVTSCVRKIHTISSSKRDPEFSKPNIDKPSTPSPSKSQTYSKYRKSPVV
jgi:hypothetical protein